MEVCERTENWSKLNNCKDKASAGLHFQSNYGTNRNYYRMTLPSGAWKGSRICAKAETTEPSAPAPSSTPTRHPRMYFWPSEAPFDGSSWQRIELSNPPPLACAPVQGSWCHSCSQMVSQPWHPTVTPRHHLLLRVLMLIRAVTYKKEGAEARTYLNVF